MANRVTYTFLLRDKFSGASRKIGSSTARLRKRIKGLGLDAKRTTKVLDKTKRAAGRIGLAAVAGSALSLKAFGDLEQGVTSVLTLLDRETELDKFRGNIEGLARDAVLMGFSIQGSTKALFDNVSFLGANQRSFDAFSASQSLAIAGVTELQTAVKGISGLMNAYKESGLSANEALNILFTGQKKGGTTVAALSENIGKVAPTARAMGVSASELVATMAELTLGALSTEEASTALRSTLSSLQKPSEDAAKVLAFLEVPFKVSEVRAAKLTGVLSALAKAEKEFPDHLARAIPNVRALTAVFTLNAESVKNIRNNMAQMDKDLKTGSGARDAVAVQMRTFNQEMARTFGAITIISTELGKSLAPAVRLVGSVLRSTIKGFLSLTEGAKSFLGGFTAIVAVFGSIAASVGVVMVLLGKGAIVAGVIAAAFSAIPLAIAAGVIALVATITFAIQKFDFLKEKALGVKNAVTGFFGGGDGGNLDVTGSAETSNISKIFSDIQLTINAPKGVVGATKVGSTGAGITNIGVNNVETR